MTDLTPGNARTAACARSRTLFPLLHLRGVDGEGEEHLAVGDDDVGKFSGRGAAACRRGLAR